MGRGGLCLPIEIDSSSDVTFANFHSYRVIHSFQPFPWAVKIPIRATSVSRNFHCDSNSKASFDTSIFDQSHEVELREHEFASLDISGNSPPAKPQTASHIVARARKLKNSPEGFQHFRRRCGFTGQFIFLWTAHEQRIYRWDSAKRQLSTTMFPSTSQHRCGSGGQFDGRFRFGRRNGVFPRCK